MPPLLALLLSKHNFIVILCVAFESVIEYVSCIKAIDYLPVNYLCKLEIF